jgi:endonuclease YncB( thermonuclease family)
VIALGGDTATGTPISSDVPGDPRQADQAIDGPPPAPPLLGMVRVDAVIDGRTVRLEDGREVRLAGILPPEPPLASRDATSGRVPGWAPAERARTALGTLLIGRMVVLHAASDLPDRYGRLHARLVRDDGLGVEAELVRSGLALVEIAGSGDQAGAGSLIDAERQARGAEAGLGAGLWASAVFALRSPEQAARLIGSFQIVEGRVVGTATVNGEVMLNFGPDWRTDFTIRIPRGGMRQFRAAALDPRRWVGRRLRVRGWIHSQNGPMIDVAYPEQIELESPISAAGMPENQ